MDSSPALPGASHGLEHSVTLAELFEHLLLGCAVEQAPAVRRLDQVGEPGFSQQGLEGGQGQD